MSNDSRKSCLELLVETERERERERVRVSRREGFERLVETERERERDSGRVIWAVCVREEGKERVLCVCGRFGQRKMRNGGAVERWSGGGFFKNENTNARTAVWEMWQLNYTRVCGK